MFCSILSSGLLHIMVHIMMPIAPKALIAVGYHWGLSYTNSNIAKLRPLLRIRYTQFYDLQFMVLGLAKLLSHPINTTWYELSGRTHLRTDCWNEISLCDPLKLVRLLHFDPDWRYWIIASMDHTTFMFGHGCGQIFTWWEHILPKVRLSYAPSCVIFSSWNFSVIFNLAEINKSQLIIYWKLP